MDALKRHRLIAAAIGIAGAALLVIAAHAGLDFGGRGFDEAIEHWLYDALMLGAAAACLARVVLRSEQRSAWLLIGLGVLAWAAGELYSTVFISDDPRAAGVSPADAGYLGFYPLAAAGLVTLLARGVGRPSRAMWLDAAIGALAVTAIGIGVLPEILPEAGGSPLEHAVNVAYPVGDVVMLVFLAAMLGLTGWRTNRVMLLVILGLGFAAVADVEYLRLSTAESSVEGGWLDVLWALSALSIALAAWQAPQRMYESLRAESWASLVPSVFLAVGVIALQTLPEEPNPLANLLWMTMVAALVLRTAVTFDENRRLFGELQTDALTRLSNRGKLLVDLRKILDPYGPREAHLLAILDLDGFKHYNDSFGHPAGDALLVRLGGQFAAALEGRGEGYRLGGDEFGAIVRGGGEEARAAIAEASWALSEQGEAFTVTSSFGICELPAEAVEPTSALQLADQRMYEQKDSRRFSAARQALAVLLSTLRARQPQLSAHVEGVSRLAVSVGHRLGLDPIELRSLARAAELHDIGKIAIPDAILDKSAGLTTDEWDFMHQHTVLGARILSAAPALEPLAAVVRSSHERWDGKGYPDGLAGEEIPLASRIIFVCDAFHAMITARPYAGARNEEEALEEIRRCAGGQFDPAVVAAFEAVRKEGFPAPEIPDEDLADIGSVVRGDITAEPSAGGPGGLAPTAGPRGPAVGAPSA